MNTPPSPIVLLLASQAGIGKTQHFSEILGNESTFAVSHPEKNCQPDLQSRFPVFIDRWLDESNLEAELKKHSFTHILFLSLSMWDENESKHLQVFVKLAHLASKYKINVFGEINLSSKSESSLMHEAVETLMKNCKNINVDMRSLEKGSAVEISFEAKEILKKFPLN